MLDILKTIDFNNVIVLINTLCLVFVAIWTRKTYHNTNSMKDELVIAARAKGAEEGRIAGEVKAADLAKGVLEGRNQTAKQE